MERIIKLLLLVGIIALCIAAEEYVARGSAVAVCVAICIVAWFIGDTTEKQECYSILLFGSSYLLGLIFLFLTQVIQVHVHVEDDGGLVQIRSRFYTHILASGNKLEETKFRYAYAEEYGFVQGLEEDTFYLVYTAKNTCIICSRFAKEVELNLPFTVKEIDFGHGGIQLLSKGETLYDLHGNLVTDNYRPIRVDHTIPDPTP